MGDSDALREGPLRMQWMMLNAGFSTATPIGALEYCPFPTDR